MNRRNAEFIMPFNPRKNYPLVDDKVRTKALALSAGLPVPRLYGVINSNHEIKGIHSRIENQKGFVIKPSRGSGGNGILVAEAGRNDLFFRTDKSVLALDEIKYHTANILSGMYSLGGNMDKAMIEYKVNFSPVFEDISFQGVPDIRIIVFKGIPVMSMLRLPTKMSAGRANLHQGAVGVGIDLSTGRTLKAVWKNRPVNSHPDTAAPLKSIQMPYWHEILLNAAQSRDIVDLDYLGVDIVLDRDLGPLILEFNARPGLSIQLANGFGLAPRLQVVQKLDKIPADAQERVLLACRFFQDSQSSE